MRCLLRFNNCNIKGTQIQQCECLHFQPPNQSKQSPKLRNPATCNRNYQDVFATQLAGGGGFHFGTCLYLVRWGRLPYGRCLLIWGQGSSPLADFLAFWHCEYWGRPSDFFPCLSFPTILRFIIHQRFWMDYFFVWHRSSASVPWTSPPPPVTSGTCTGRRSPR